MSDTAQFVHNRAMDMGVIGLRFPIGSATTGLQPGTAHFTEHLICNELVNYGINSIEARTGRDETVYWWFLTQSELWTIKYVISVIHSLTLDFKAFIKEKSVIKKVVSRSLCN